MAPRTGGFRGRWAWIDLLAGGACVLGLSGRVDAQDPGPDLGIGHRRFWTSGTLGYGDGSPRPGYYGFGNVIGRGYGYGGHSLGVGAEGGYPYYGGPGYSRGGPPLNRLGPIRPTLYGGSPGRPDACHPYFYGAVGPLAADPPVVAIGDDRSEPGSGADYGCFTGAIPYPDDLFAPYSRPLGATIGTTDRPSPAPPPRRLPLPPLP